MELRQIEFFLAVAEELHFGKAAAKLHISEQPLGYQIRKLETELGFLLFERTTRSVVLTPAGKAFATKIERVLKISEQAIDTGRRVAAGKEGVLSLGYESSAAPAILHGFIKEFKKAYPQFDLVTQECSTGGIPLLIEGVIDACLVTRFVRLPQWVEYHPIRKDGAVLALPKNHPLASSKEVSITDLSDLPFLGYGNQGGETANAFMTQLASKYDLNFHQEAETHMSLLSLVAAGMGYTALTDSMSKLMSGEVAYVRLVEPKITLDHGLAFRKEELFPAHKEAVIIATHLAKQYS